MTSRLGSLSPGDTIRGRLGGADYFSDLLIRLHRRQFTGLLRLGVEGMNRLSLREGIPLSVALATTEITLGRLLVEQEVITTDIYRRTLDQARREGRLHGQVLLAARIIDEPTLHQTLTSLNLRKITWLFAMHEVDYELLEGEHHLPSREAAPLPLPAALIHGLREQSPVHQLARFANQLLGKAVRILPSAPPGEALQVPPPLLPLLELLRTFRRPEYLEQSLPGIRRRDVRALLLALDYLQLLETAHASAAAPLLPPRRDRLPPSPQLTSARPDQPAEPPGLTADQAERRREILRRHAALGEQNYFEVLGISPEAPIDEVSRVYTQLAKRFHPDLLSTGPNADIIPQAEALLARVSEAFRTLSNVERRAAYRKRLQTGAERAAASPESARQEATLYATKGRMELRRRNFSVAAEHYRRAGELDPTDPAHRAERAWCLMNCSDGDRRAAWAEARQLLDEALRLRPDHGPALYYRGLLAKQEGKLTAARGYFQRAATEADHGEAQRELRLMRMRGQGAPTRGEGRTATAGLLRKLFKK